jgi:hypothetical protein
MYKLKSQSFLHVRTEYNGKLAKEKEVVGEYIWASIR